MRICKKLICLTVLLFAVYWCVDLVQDKMCLKENLIRLHVVANSDSKEDQQIKLQVRDAIIEQLTPVLESFSDMDQAKAYIQDCIPTLEAHADRVLTMLGVDDKTKITLQEEKFDVRHYETFSLPSGIYESLRVEIGNGEGKNWWCVVFPTLCVPAASDSFHDTAVASGFHEQLVDTISNEEGYTIRFFFLDVLGKLENLFFEV